MESKGDDITSYLVSTSLIVSGNEKSLVSSRKQEKKPAIMGVIPNNMGRIVAEKSPVKCKTDATAEPRRAFIVLKPMPVCLCGTKEYFHKHVFT